jgi:hypothetical protein
MARRALGGVTALVVAGLLAGSGTATAAAATTAATPASRCVDIPVTLAAGTAATLALDCRQRTRGRLVVRARGRQRGASRTLLSAPLVGRLGRLDAASGRVRYTAPTGRDRTVRVGYAVRLASGRRYTGRVVIHVRRAPRPAVTGTVASAIPSPQPATATTPSPTPVLPAGDGLPPVLPAVPASVASSTRGWQPTAYDTCPAALHDRFSVVAPDGKRHPTWHPPTVTDPATGRSCTFGHEHGDDPRTSDLYAAVVDHFRDSTYPDFAGVPFGLAAESLNTWSDAHPPQPRRSEDHVGYKVDVANDVKLLGADGAPTGVTCDYLTVAHQGSHSADALSNNVHEVIYAVGCDDGTRVVTDTIHRFGNAGEYERSCDPAVRVTTTDNGYPDGDGVRSIPDRVCAERDVLVPPGRTTSPWALYEKWSSGASLELAGGGPPLVAFEAAWGVFDPSRYADPAGAGGIGRTFALCSAAPGAGGTQANGGECASIQAGATAFDDPRAGLDGTHRDVYLAGTTVRNQSGPRRWYTDPYGGGASPSSFPGAVCQLVAPVDSGAGQAARTRVFGRGVDHEDDGVHAPN